MTHRVEASLRRTDKRKWVMQRREHTRHLIELGGLVHKAGLVELTDDDRTVLLGAFLAVAAMLQSDERAQSLTHSGGGAASGRLKMMGNKILSSFVRPESDQR
jgi:Conjugal transfer protein TraD